MAISANATGRNVPSYSFYFIFSVIPLINAIESSNNLMILIIAFIFSFKTNKANLFSCLTAPFPLILFQTYLLHLKLHCLLIEANYVLLSK